MNVRGIRKQDVKRGVYRWFGREKMGDDGSVLGCAISAGNILGRME